MRWLLGNKPARKSAQAQMAVEGLEDRALMAANFTLADTLNAKDTIQIQELNIIQGIQNAKLNDSGFLQQVIISGQNATNTLVGQFVNLLTLEQQDRAAGNLVAVQQDLAQERQTLANLHQIRSLMRQAVATDTVVQNTLWNDQQAVSRQFHSTVNNLSRGNNPFLTVPHATTALNLLGLRAQQHANAGANRMQAINNQINGFLPPPLVPIGG